MNKKLIIFLSFLFSLVILLTLTFYFFPRNKNKDNNNSQESLIQEEKEEEEINKEVDNKEENEEKLNNSQENEENTINNYEKIIDEYKFFAVHQKKNLILIGIIMVIGIIKHTVSKKEIFEIIDFELNKLDFIRFIFIYITLILIFNFFYYIFYFRYFCLKFKNSFMIMMFKFYFSSWQKFIIYNIIFAPLLIYLISRLIVKVVISVLFCFFPALFKYFNL